MRVRREIHNSCFTNGIIGPSSKMLGPIDDGGEIVFHTAPGCWGPMITPSLRGGHEVCCPVAVDGASVNDSIAIRIKRVIVKSKASSSGTHKTIRRAYTGDPFIAKKCPNCGVTWPKAVKKGKGIGSIICERCGKPASPFRMTNGYTMVFDSEMKLGITVNANLANRIANSAKKWSLIPKGSSQFPALLAAKADIIGVQARVRSMIGHLGTTPSIDIPDSKNAGDVGLSLVGASHQYSLTKGEFEDSITDAHLDIDSVREGATLICPVKVRGGGVYCGDVHALQGDGEAAGHAVDVAARVEVKVEVIKKLKIGGPILIPLPEDLPPLAKPFDDEFRKRALELAENYNIELEEQAPIQFIGTGKNINEAANNSFKRASQTLRVSYDEIRNRATITGGVEIGRLPGVVHTTLTVPMEKLERLGIADYTREQYRLVS